MGGNDDGIVIHHLTVIRINGRHDVGNLCAVRSRGSLKAVKHIVCRHLLPVVEIHVVSQLKLPV